MSTERDTYSCYLRFQSGFTNSYESIKGLNEELRSSNIVINYVRNVFKSFSLILTTFPESISLAKGFKSMDKALSHSMFIIDFIKIPLKAFAPIRSIKKTYIYVSKVLLQMKNGEPVEGYLVLKVVEYSAKSVAKTISVVDLIIFSPISFLHDHYKFDDLDRYTKPWAYFSLGSKVFKIVHKSCAIIEGKEDGVLLMIDIAFNVSSVVLKVVKLSGYKVHPAISLTFGIGENLFKIFKVLRKTL